MVRLGLDRASSVSAWLNFAGNQNSKSKGEHEGKRAATRQYAWYGEEPRSAADSVQSSPAEGKGIHMSWNWNETARPEQERDTAQDPGRP